MSYESESKIPSDVALSPEPCEPCRIKSEVRTWSSEQLLGDRGETLIVHHGVIYRLLRTRNDKLILVK